MIDAKAIDPQRIRPADAPQIKMAPRELDRLANHISEQYNAALADHQTRQDRFRTMYLRWRSQTEEIYPGMFLVPLTQWHVFSKWAKEHAAQFGDDAEVMARPVGPSDQRNVHKCGRFMTWLIKDHMALQNKAATFNFRKILFGRSIAYAPWVRDTFMVPLADGTEEESVHYEGPGFDPCWPDDIVLPAEERAQTIHDFSWVVRKYRATPDELLEKEGSLYQGITAKFGDIVAAATTSRNRDRNDSPIQSARDIAEGVLYDDAMSAGNTLQVIEWYGKWRELKDGYTDARPQNVKRRRKYESEIVVRYLPALNGIFGIQSLAQMYPLKKKRRPFVEASLVKDGTYWPAGFGELLEAAERELTVNHHVAGKAGRMSIGPVIFYSAASGFDPATFEYEPDTAVEVENPAGINVVQFKADLSYPVLKEQTVNGYAERITGQSDMNLGRSVDRPNAPRTARGTMALIEQGDIRASLDVAALREDWGAILDHFFDMVAMYAPKDLFFRVTEEDSKGLFQVAEGGARMTESDRFGRYDFDLKFATSAISKEQKKEETIILYQTAVQNPIILQDPRALWQLLNKLFKAFGDDNFMDIVPEPPDPGLPVSPKLEWSRLSQGEEINVNPQDNDDLHLLDHQFRYREATDSENPNPLAISGLQEHMIAHVQQRQQKKMMAELAGALASRLGGMLPGNMPGGGGMPGGGMPGMMQQQQQQPPQVGTAQMPGGIPQVFGQE